MEEMRRIAAVEGDEAAGSQVGEAVGWRGRGWGKRGGYGGGEETGRAVEAACAEGKRT